MTRQLLSSNLAPARRRHGEGAFTLIEIMIVVTIVAILSLLAMVGVGQIKEKAARTVILNNLRQLYQAKEYFYSETAMTKATTVETLANMGYIRQSMKARLRDIRTLEAGMGWHYATFINPGGSPVYAYKGYVPIGVRAQPDGSMNLLYTDPDTPIIWYPAPPGKVTYVDPQAATNTQPPTPPVVAGPPVPAGMKGGSNPQAPWVAAQPQSMGFGSGVAVLRVDMIMQSIGAQNPPGTGQAPLKVTNIQVDPAFGSIYRGFNPTATSFEIDGNPRAVAGQVYHMSVTVSNGHGETTVSIPISRQ